MTSKTIIKTKDNKQLTLLNGYYKDGMFYGYNRYNKLLCVDVSNIKNKKLTWI